MGTICIRIITQKMEKVNKKPVSKARLLFTTASEQENTPYNLHQQADALHLYCIIRLRECPVHTDPSDISVPDSICVPLSP